MTENVADKQIVYPVPDVVGTNKSRKSFSSKVNFSKKTSLLFSSVLVHISHDWCRSREMIVTLRKVDFVPKTKMFLKLCSFKIIDLILVLCNKMQTQQTVKVFTKIRVNQ